MSHTLAMSTPTSTLTFAVGRDGKDTILTPCPHRIGSWHTRRAFLLGQVGQLGEHCRKVYNVLAGSILWDGAIEARGRGQDTFVTILPKSETA